jgi:hypothetical protein
MIERNGSDCKYVEIFTHHAGSTGAPSRRTDFSEGQTPNVKKSQILRVGTRNLIFSNREVQDLRPQ